MVATGSQTGHPKVSPERAACNTFVCHREPCEYEPDAKCFRRAPHDVPKAMAGHSIELAQSATLLASTKSDERFAPVNEYPLTLLVENNINFEHILSSCVR